MQGWVRAARPTLPRRGWAKKANPEDWVSWGAIEPIGLMVDYQGEAERTMRNQAEVFNDLVVLRCQGGDADALELLARTWHPRVLGHAFRLTGQRDAAAEVAQDAWVAIVRGIKRLHDPAVFRGWIYRIVANKASDWIRRRQARRKLNARVEREPPSAGNGEEADDREAAIRRLRAALETLPDDRRMLLSMHYLEKMGIREIAFALEVPAGTVKSRLFHARKQLKQTLTHQRSTS